MVIKSGYNNKKTEITIAGNCKSPEAYIWIEQKGLKKVQKTLALATIEELLELRFEINEALKVIVGLTEL